MLGRLLISLVVLALVHSGVGSEDLKKSYHGYEVLRTQRLSSRQASALSKLEHLPDFFDFWRPISSGQAVDIMSSPEHLSDLKGALRFFGIEYETLIEDVEILIRASNVSSRANAHKADETALDWTDYYDYEEINAYMDSLARQFDFVESVSIGESYEGRATKLLKIAKAGPGKPNIWIEAGIHAREWVSISVSTYLMGQLLTTEEGKPYLDELNFYILPMTNPDGYDYSWHYDRMWRKTRSFPKYTKCRGADANRNFDFHWSESGVSFIPCTDVYPGENPFSEVEARNIRDYFLSVSPTPILAQTFHSYSQLWLYPYGYNYGEYPENVDELVELARDAVDALQGVHGSEYTVMNAANFYAASGASDDWYAGVAGARFVYTVELRDTGKFGFLLPTDQLIPCGEEIWAAEKVLFDKMIRLTSKSDS